jgi:hypothetical protein
VDIQIKTYQKWRLNCKNRIKNTAEEFRSQRSKTSREYAVSSKDAIEMTLRLKDAKTLRPYDAMTP